MKNEQNDKHIESGRTLKEVDIAIIGIILPIVLVAIGIVVSRAEKTEDYSTLQLISNLCLATAIVLCVILAIKNGRHGNAKQCQVYSFISIVLVVLTISVNLFFAEQGSQPPPPSPTPTVTSAPVTPAPTPPPTSLPTSGTSTSGSILRDVQYSDEGRIVRASEKMDGKWVEWEYVYSDTGSFKYRKRNIGSVDCTLTDVFMTGKDTSYTKLNEKIENCVGFTLSYSVSNVRHGNYEGEREVYFSGDTISWRLIGTFEYNSMTRVEIPFVLDPAESFIAFATPRTHPDDSSFNVNQSIVDVWVADYEYVEIVTEE